MLKEILNFFGSKLSKQDIDKVVINEARKLEKNRKEIRKDYVILGNTLGDVLMNELSKRGLSKKDIVVG